MAADPGRSYTFRPAPGVLLGALVPVGSWAESRRARDDFHEEARRKRQRDAAMVEEMRRRAPSGVFRCERRLEAEPEVVEEPQPAPHPPSPPTPAPRVGVALAAPPTDCRLPYQRLFDPGRVEQYVGNDLSRKRALDWLQKWKLDALRRRPRSVEEAMLLLWGPVGTGKSAWAQYIAVQAGFEVVRFTPGDVGSHNTQNLKFWLQTQTATGLRGKKLFAVILDDVEELFRDCKGATRIKVPCPVIATAGPSVSASLRNRADLALSFRRILRFDAFKVVRRIRPQADADFAKHVEEQAGGDLRQIIIKASGNGAWCGRGSTDLYQTCSGRAKAVLNGDAPLRLNEWDHEGWRGGLSDLLIHHNFNKCCPDETFLVRYANFLQVASTLDEIRATNLMAFAARAWRGRRSGETLDALPAAAPRAADADEEEAPALTSAAQESSSRDEEDAAASTSLRGFVARRNAAGEALPLEAARDDLDSLPDSESAEDPEVREDERAKEIKKKLKELKRRAKQVRKENELHSVYRRPYFKPGLDLACELFRKQFGGPIPAAQRRHEAGEPITVACLSPSLRLGTDHVDDLLDCFHRLASPA